MAHFDLFVIGGGSGGVACARRAASHGAKVGIAERSRMGGTCVIRGCVPKKLMHYGAHFSAAFTQARAYGWQFDEPRLDLRRLLEARNAEIARLNGIYIDMLERAGAVIFGHEARLVSDRNGKGHTIAVGGEEHTAERVLIAVGASPSLPPVDGIEHAITSDDVLERVYDLPRRLLIVGGGYIGVEFASIFCGLGSEVSVVLRADEPLRGFDADLRRELTGQMRLQGVDFHCHTTVDRMRAENGTISVETSAGRFEAEAVIYATGRKPVPNTRGIGLEERGVAMDESGAVRVDRSYRTNIEGLYAVGDCSDHADTGLNSGHHDLTPVAIAEGRVIAETLFNDNPHEVAYDSIPTAVFGIPQAGAVGMTEETARERGLDVLVYKTRFRPMIETLVGGDTKAFMKLITERTSGRVLGCHLVADDAAETVQGLAIALTAGATKADFDETVGVHPTAAEEFVTMFQPASG